VQDVQFAVAEEPGDRVVWRRPGAATPREPAVGSSQEGLLYPAGGSSLALVVTALSYVVLECAAI